MTTIYELLSNKISLFKEVIQLSYERSLFKKTSVEYKQKEIEIYEFLCNIDYEDLKMIQTIMYIGQDSGPSKYESMLESYQSMRNSFGSNQENHDSDAYAVSCKRPLHEFLGEGLNKLGFDIPHK
ncbi:hypothetical protein [Bacillus subtilis]|uniref:Uncharacterized protein n=1 Tax=Bacillus subtilis TaxID=1423 RepID=A0A8I2B6P3_BACIU|nr:hypothetical protein [Bacillus subtilis]KAF2421645.1 hypothetical protein B6K89_20850 [Bacillus subtilis]MBO3794219.1 hypothetical protein [Bacillus subtilis]